MPWTCLASSSTAAFPPAPFPGLVMTLASDCDAIMKSMGESLSMISSAACVCRRETERGTGHYLAKSKAMSGQLSTLPLLTLAEKASSIS